MSPFDSEKTLLINSLTSHSVSQKQMGLNEAGSLPVTEDKTRLGSVDAQNESGISTRLTHAKQPEGALDELIICLCGAIGSATDLYSVGCPFESDHRLQP